MFSAIASSSDLQAAAVVSPVYQVVGADVTWSQQGSSDTFTAPAAAYVYAEERWELPVEADKWSISGTTLSNDGEGKYYEYIDMQFGQLGADDDFLYMSWQTQGDRIYIPGSGFEANGLEGLYYGYFGLPGKPDILISLPGTVVDMSDEFTDISAAGWGKAYEDRTTDSGSGQDVPGPGGDPIHVGTPGQGGTGFDTELSNADIYGRVIGTVVEVAVDLSSLGLTVDDVGLLDYAYLGAARSNPSGPNDVFVNDHFAADFEGAEYDNIRMGTTLIDPPLPEPSSVVLAFLGTLLLLRRRR